jgi:ADP-heptose:LPS heptosyltransferase
LNTKATLLLNSLNEQLNFADLKIDDSIQISESAINIILNSIDKLMNIFEKEKYKSQEVENRFLQKYETKIHFKQLLLKVDDIMKLKYMDKISFFSRIKNTLFKINFESLKNMDIEFNQNTIDIINVKKILVICPNNSLSKKLLITPLLQELNQVFPDASISLLLRGDNCRKIFENYRVNKIIKLPKNLILNFFIFISVLNKLKENEFDLVVNFDNNSKLGLLCTHITKSHFKLYNSQMKSFDYNYWHMAKNPILNLRNFYIDKNINCENLSIPKLDIKLSKFEIASGRKKIMRMFQNSNKKHIVIYTNLKSNNKKHTQFWLDLYAKLALNLKEDYNFIEILRTESISILPFGVKKYYSNDIRSIANLISNCEIFISPDCDMMHLSSASNTTTIGLFKNKSILKYIPYGDKSTGIDIKKNGLDNVIKIINHKLNNLD